MIEFTADVGELCTKPYSTKAVNKILRHPTTFLLLGVEGPRRAQIAIND